MLAFYYYIYTSPITYINKKKNDDGIYRGRLGWPAGFPLLRQYFERRIDNDPRRAVWRPISWGFRRRLGETSGRPRPPTVYRSFSSRLWDPDDPSGRCTGAEPFRPRPLSCRSERCENRHGVLQERKQKDRFSETSEDTAVSPLSPP